MKYRFYLLFFSALVSFIGYVVCVVIEVDIVLTFLTNLHQSGIILPPQVKHISVFTDMCLTCGVKVAELDPSTVLNINSSIIINNNGVDADQVLKNKLSEILFTRNQTIFNSVATPNGFTIYCIDGPELTKLLNLNFVSLHSGCSGTSQQMFDAFKSLK